MPRTSRLLLVACAVAIGCASGRTVTAGRAEPNALPERTRVQGPGLLFDVLYTDADRGEVTRVASALLAAGPLLHRWGAFREGIVVRVYPDHDALEGALEKRGYPWLRAWAYGDQILLQSPRTWTSPSAAATDEELRELVAHELTHSLMYQLMEPRDGPPFAADVPFEEPPIWFREGMASVTARQGHRRMSSEELAGWITKNPLGNPLRPTGELYRTEKEAVYGASHRAFDLLVAVSGEQAVRDVLRGVREGARFADAFKAATGMTLAAFESEALRSRFDPVAGHFRSSGAGGF